MTETIVIASSYELVFKDSPLTEEVVAMFCDVLRTAIWSEPGMSENERVDALKIAVDNTTHETQVSPEHGVIHRLRAYRAIPERLADKSVYDGGWLTLIIPAQDAEHLRKAADDLDTTAWKG